MSDAINQQIDGKTVSVKVEPKVDSRAAEDAGRQVREGAEKHTRDVAVEAKVDRPAAEKAGREVRDTVEKHTRDVAVEATVDTRAAEDVGRQTGEAVAKGSSTALGQLIIGALQGIGGEAGQRLGEALADSIPTGMSGAAERIGTALRNSLPQGGQVAGQMLGAAIGIAVTDAIGKERLDKAGRAILAGLERAVKAANTGTDIGVAIGNAVASGLTNSSGVLTTAAGKITSTVDGIGSAIGAAKQLLGDDSWAAPGLDSLNSALGTAAPLLESMNSAATLASTGAQAISTATGLASKAQLLWNAALIANPLGLIVTAIGAVVAALVLFFTKTELGRKIWEGFTEYLKAAWEVIKSAFSAAWDAIGAIWDAMVTKAGQVWEGIKSKFTAVVDFVKGLPGAISSAASGMWDGISNAFKSMVDRMKGWWNDFAGALSFTTPEFLPGEPVTFSLPTFGGGGHTGTMAADKAAGVVHGGEFVVRKESTDRIQNAYPGLLDYLNNQGALPGYASGGIVALGNISGPGITTKEQQSMWDAIRSVFPDAILTSATRTVMTEGHPDFHNAGKAIDISGPSMGRIASWIAANYPGSLELIHSPFGRNIKNGKNVGDGVGYYGQGLMNAHADHVHWALGKTAKSPVAAENSAAQAEAASGATTSIARPPKSDMLSALGVDSSATSSLAAAQPSTVSSAEDGAASKFSVPGSLSEIGSWAGQYAGDQVGSAANNTDPRLKTAMGGLGDLGSAAGGLIDGQVGSALGVLGVNGSPGWLQGLSTFIGGISVGGGDGAASVAPMAATSAVSRGAQAAGSALGSVHNGSGAQPGPGPVYNIRTATVEDAFLQSQRLERERAAAKLSRY